MVWSVFDLKGQSHPVPGKVCVVFQDEVSAGEATVFLDQFKPKGVSMYFAVHTASVDVGEGNEDAFIATVLQHPDKVKAAEREMSIILFGGSQFGGNLFGEQKP